MHKRLTDERFSLLLQILMDFLIIEPVTRACNSMGNEQIHRDIQEGSSQAELQVDKLVKFLKSVPQGTFDEELTKALLDRISWIQSPGSFPDGVGMGGSPSEVVTENYEPGYFERLATVEDPKSRNLNLQRVIAAIDKTCLDPVWTYRPKNYPFKQMGRSLK